MQVRAGGESTDAITVTNLSETALSLDFAAADAFTNKTGQLTLNAPDKPSRFAGKWIMPQVRTAVIPARSSINVPFTVKVPDNAQPGDYVAGVMASKPQRQTGADGQEVVVESRVATRVYLRVPGKITPQLTVTALAVRRDAPWWDFLDGRVEMNATVTNTGNARMDSAIAATFSGPFGIVLGSTASEKLPQLLPGDSFRLSSVGGSAAGLLVATGIGAPGFISANVELNARVSDGADAVRVETRTTIMAIPWVPLAAFAMIAIAVAVWLVCARMRRRSARSVAESRM